MSISTQARKLLVGLGVIAVIAIVVGIVTVVQVRKETGMTDDQIKAKFDCDRKTADSRATDIYCMNPEYYREDVRKGNVIDPNDFDDPRIKTRSPT